MKRFRYYVYGITIESELELPELVVYRGSNADVFIKYGNVPDHLSYSKKKGVLFEAAPGDFIFRFESVGAFRVRDGNLIIVQPDSSVSYDDLRVFLLGSAMGALLHQRNVVPLHGSAIVTAGGAVIITGMSSTGKSSLAAALSNYGFDVLADDISVVTETITGKYVVHPGIPYFKLWKDTLNSLNINEELIRVRPSVEKYRKPIDQFHRNESPHLYKIVTLSIKNTPGITHKEITGANKFTILRNNTYRVEYIDGFNQSGILFQQLTQLSNAVELILLERPNIPDTINELAKYVVDNII